MDFVEFIKKMLLKDVQVMASVYILFSVMNNNQKINLY